MHDIEEIFAGKEFYPAGDSLTDILTVLLSTISIVYMH